MDLIHRRKDERANGRSLPNRQGIAHVDVSRQANAQDAMKLRRQLLLKSIASMIHSSSSSSSFFYFSSFPFAKTSVQMGDPFQIVKVSRTWIHPGKLMRTTQ
jgi:hypothetical protein